MKVFINALSARLGGGQTYLINLLKHLPQMNELEVIILVQPSFILNDLPKNVIRIEQKGLINPFVRKVWEETCLIKLLHNLKVDVFFSPGGMLPSRLQSHILKVVTFQNMLPFELEQRKKYSYSYRWVRDWLLQKALSSAMIKADLVIFISKFAKDFINQELPSLSGRNIVIPHGLAPMFLASEPKPLPSQLSFKHQKYLLYVSFIDFYKAQLEIVRGYALFRQSGGEEDLVLAGAEYPRYGKLLREEIESLGLTRYVHILGNVPHEQLPSLYQNAKVNIFASYVENCPNILFEMMASGRPCLVSKHGPMPEFGKNGVEYFEPSDEHEIERKLRELVGDKRKQETLVSIASELVLEHSWQDSSEKTWGAIYELGINQ